MAICSVPQLSASRATFRNVSSTDMSQVRLALLCQILQSFSPMATCDVPTLLNRAKCFCSVTKKPEEMLELQLLCEISSAVSGSEPEPVCIIGGVGPPVGTPPCNFSVYIQQPGPNFGLWLGDTVKGWGNVILQGP